MDNKSATKIIIIMWNTRSGGVFCFWREEKNEFIMVKVYHIMAKIYSSYFWNKTIRQRQRDWSGIVKETRRIESFILQKVHGLNQDLVNIIFGTILGL